MNSGLGTWTDFTGVANLLIDPRDSRSLFATIGGRIFHTTDAAGHWTEITSGLSVIDIIGLMLDSQNPGTLYAGTAGGGLFSTTLPEEQQ
jgi:hypothetical protein